MYILAGSPFKYQDDKILHITYPHELKEPQILNAMLNIQSKQQQIIHPSIHELIEPRFDYFSTYVVHGCSPDHFDDYLKKLKEDPWPKRFQKIKDSDIKTIIFLGNTLNMLGPKIIKMPSQLKLFLSPLIKSFKIDIDTQGLNFLPYRIDDGFSEKIKNNAYVDAISLISQHEEIILFDFDTVWSSLEGTKFGSAYIGRHGKIMQLREIDKMLKPDEKDAERERKIKPPKAIYVDEENSTTEKRLDEKTTAKETNKEIQLR